MASDLEFGGEEHFNAPPQRVFEELTDLDVLAQNIPDLVSANRVNDRTLNCVVRPGFSFLRGTLRMNIELTELSPPTTAAMRIDASGIGQTIRVASQMNISSDKGGSLLRWTAQVIERRGLVATISASLIRAAAGQVIQEAWQKVHARIEAR